jgi:hypothetical protein
LVEEQTENPRVGSGRTIASHAIGCKLDKAINLLFHFQLLPDMLSLFSRYQTAAVGDL